MSCAGALLLKYNASEARVVAAQWFQAARDYLPSAAAGNPLPPVDINVAIANSAFANMTQAVSQPWPLHLHNALCRKRRVRKSDGVRISGWVRCARSRK